MKQRPRIYYAEGDKALMWDRWQKGESLSSIARWSDHQKIVPVSGGSLANSGQYKRSENCLCLASTRLTYIPLHPAEEMSLCCDT